MDLVFSGETDHNRGPIRMLGGLYSFSNWRLDHNLGKRGLEYPTL